ncbi:MAG: PA domain-containing protein [Vicinamibacterales bacterium]
MKARLLLSLALPALLAAAEPAFAGARITIVNMNAPGVGFNDPTPAAPIGGNTGTTVGEQRLIAFQHAADLWGAALDSGVEIRVQASFEPLSCTATAGTLGSAGPLFVLDNFDGAGFANTWYTVAEANKLSGVDNEPTGNDIRARFNANLGTPGCLAASRWYYGLDPNQPVGQINLVTVLLHEFAHGLGFLSLANPTTGELFFDQSDIFLKNYFDNSGDKSSDELTTEQRLASFTNPRRVVWSGDRVTAAVPHVLSPGTPLLRVTSPASVQGDYPVGAAVFGPPVMAAGISGTVVLALDPSDAAGASTTDACSPIANASSVAGRIALVDRGTCGFTVKVKNAQNAGAIAVLVADNVAGGPPAGLGGADPTITIPAVRITLDAGDALKAALSTGTVSATLTVDLAIRAGADRKDRAMLYTPNPVLPGSSVSHWDTSASPNQLMEPAISADLTHSLTAPQDLTLAQMRDIGWYLDRDIDRVPDEKGDRCLGSNLSETVVIGTTDTGVHNGLAPNGCTASDYIALCDAKTKRHGVYLACVVRAMVRLVAREVIGKDDAKTIFHVVLRQRAHIHGRQDDDKDDEDCLDELD